MINYSGAILVHKRHVRDLIRSSDQELTIRLPVARTSSEVNPLFGDMTREANDTGSTIGPFACVWYDALSARSMGASGTGFERTVETLAGQYRNATAFAEIWLDDVLQDTEEPAGRTWFDEAKHIVHLNNKYDFLGEVRLGLATAAPYIMMVVLKGGAGYHE